MRQDGAFIEAGENDNLIVQRLDADPTAYGIFGYSFLYENQDKLQPVLVGGVAPSFETIETGEYGVSRPLFFYIKNAHRGVIPGLDDFIAEYVSEEAMGPGGYLSERGMVPLNDSKRAEERRARPGPLPMMAPEVSCRGAARPSGLLARAGIRSRDRMPVAKQAASGQRISRQCSARPS